MQPKGDTRQCLVTKDWGENPADKDITGWKSCNTHTDKNTRGCALMRQTHTQISTHLILSKKSQRWAGEEREGGRWPERRQSFFILPRQQKGTVGNCEPGLNLASGPCTSEGGSGEGRCARQKSENPGERVEVLFEDA